MGSAISPNTIDVLLYTLIVQQWHGLFAVIIYLETPKNLTCRLTVTDVHTHGQ